MADDVLCQLCGVPFVIGRIRTKNEPRSAAFNRQAGKWVAQPFTDYRTENYVAPRYKAGCSDCSIVFRETEYWNRPGIRPWNFALWSDSDHDPRISQTDPDYEDESDSDSDPLEYDSDHDPRISQTDPDYEDESDSDSDPLEYDSDHDPRISQTDPDYEDESDSDSDPLEYDSDAAESQGGLDGEESPSVQPTTTEEPDWTFRVNGPNPPEYDTDFLPMSLRLGRTPRVLYARNDALFGELRSSLPYYEHIAAPSCRHDGGYNGNYLSADEARGCRTVQCIFPKTSTWTPSPVDLDFEREGDYHLTGVARFMPNSGIGLRFAPAKQGVDHINAHNSWILADANTPDELGLPFHPTCFEIFRQASRRFLGGKVDIANLFRLRNEYMDDRGSNSLNAFSMLNPSLSPFQDGQPWIHKFGSEYLAANPLFIPSFRPILDRAISDDAEFDVNGSPFLTSTRIVNVSAAPDLFQRLSLELKLKIVSHLNSSAIASLRLCSRAFTHLPISLWRQLITTEMPWIYEAWSSDPTPYYWATVNADDKHQAKEAWEKFDEEFNYQLGVMKQEAPEIADIWAENKLSSWEWPEHPDRREFLALSPIRLPPDRTNWYQLYCDISKNKKLINGLRNRERVWNLVMTFIKDIQKI